MRMSAESNRNGPEGDVPAVAAARERLDRAMLGYNRHALLAERFRLAVARFHASRAAFESGVADRERWREARAAAARSRDEIRLTIREYAHRLRDEGVAPERMLVAVKDRLRLSATPELPGAPAFEASTLESDASAWAIEAYYEAA